MKKTWARCANCGKATWYCAKHGCKPNQTPWVLRSLDGARFVSRLNPIEVTGAESLALTFTDHGAAYSTRERLVFSGAGMFAVVRRNPAK